MNNSVVETNSYDVVPYEGHCYAGAHIDQLGMIGTLFGMAPANLNQCRVLELGCAAGRNLIPQACAFPGSHFVGIDSSAGQIATGRRMVEALGLTNIELLQADIRKLPLEGDRFDYIIAHGVLSWVPSDVRDSLFHLCQARLSAQGVAYVSYNTFPGWRLRQIVRDYLAFAVRDQTTAKEKLRTAREFLAFLQQGLGESKRHLDRAEHEELQFLAAIPDWFLFHDTLEAENQPFHLYQVVAQAKGHGFQYLGDAELSKMVPRDFSKPVQEFLRTRSKTTADLEQHLDFLRNEVFRQTLFCQSDLVLDRDSCDHRVEEFFFAAPIFSSSQTPSFAAGVPLSFTNRRGDVIESDDPLVKAAFWTLSEAWPCALPWAELQATAWQTVQKASFRTTQLSEANAGLKAALLQGLFIGVVHFYLHQPQCCNTPGCATPGEKPLASPLIRLECSLGDVVTNAYHQEITLKNEYSRFILSRADGLRTLDELLAEIHKATDDEKLTVSNAQADSLTQLRSREMLVVTLTRLAQEALLIG